MSTLEVVLRSREAPMPQFVIHKVVVACFALSVALMAAAVAHAQSPAAVDPASYRVGPEDVLEISVWREDALRKEALVRPDGGISYPLIGDVQAAGKTIAELRAEITKRLEKFIPDAVVSVTVLKTASLRIYVLG